jgi:hypothetical protein
MVGTAGSQHRLHGRCAVGRRSHRMNALPTLSPAYAAGIQKLHACMHACMRRKGGLAQVSTAGSQHTLHDRCAGRQLVTLQKCTADLGADQLTLPASRCRMHARSTSSCSNPLMLTTHRRSTPPGGIGRRPCTAACGTSVGAATTRRHGGCAGRQLLAHTSHPLQLLGTSHNHTGGCVGRAAWPSRQGVRRDMTASREQTSAQRGRRTGKKLASCAVSRVGDHWPHC